MGFDDPCFSETEDDMIRGLLDSEHPFVRGITIEQLDHEHSVRLKVAPNGDPFMPFAEGGFGTDSGKCNLALPDYVPPEESRLGSGELLTRYPLELISPKNDDSMNSTFGNRPDTDRQTSFLEMHTADASRRGIADGDAVRVFNDRGDCFLTARVNGTVRPGVVCAPSTRSPRRALHGRGVNSLTSDRLTDIGGGPSLYSCLVEVEKAGD